MYIIWDTDLLFFSLYEIKEKKWKKLKILIEKYDVLKKKERIVLDVVSVVVYSIIVYQQFDNNAWTHLHATFNVNQTVSSRKFHFCNWYVRLVLDWNFRKVVVSKFERKIYVSVISFIERTYFNGDLCQCLKMYIVLSGKHMIFQFN